MPNSSLELVTQPSGFPVRCISTERLIDALKDNTDTNRVYTYADLSMMAGGGLVTLDLQYTHRYMLRSAVATLRREFQRVYLCQTNVGIKLATPAEASESERELAKHVHRKASKSIEVMSCVPRDQLDDEGKTIYYRNLTFAGALKLFTSRKGRNLIQARVIANQQQLSATETLRLFAPK